MDAEQPLAPDSPIVPTQLALESLRLLAPILLAYADQIRETGAPLSDGTPAEVVAGELDAAADIVARSARMVERDSETVCTLLVRWIQRAKWWESRCAGKELFLLDYVAELDLPEGETIGLCSLEDYDYPSRPKLPQHPEDWSHPSSP